MEFDELVVKIDFLGKVEDAFARDEHELTCFEDGFAVRLELFNLHYPYFHLVSIIMVVS